MIETTRPGNTLTPLNRPSPALGWSDRQLHRHGVPHRILSGALHYFRVHPELWRDRIRRLADLGLNTLDTYVPWNFHQPHADRAPRFDGWHDLEAFVALAGEEGLDVVLRPGPYICAEWSNGGLPAWLTARDVALRSSDPAFTGPVERWFDELIPRVARQQTQAGGPVVAVQVENEYGSYGDDEAYLRWIRSALLDRGITELLFTADGPTELMHDAGTVPGTLAAATLGSKPEAARSLFARRRPDEPFVVAEYWNGWFDHWGERHHVRAVDSAVKTLDAIIDEGGSVSLYMAHGGTNFGLWAGANADRGRLQPTITSYDSDAPIAEDGTLTAKFHAMRAALGATGQLRVSERMPVLPPAQVPLTHRADLIAGVRAVPTPESTGARPATFEQLGLDAGMVLLTAHPRIPTGDHVIILTDVRDRAIVLVDGVPIGVADSEHPELPIRGAGAAVRLEILVENLGRINYGPLVGQHKGLLGPVLVDRRIVHGWASSPIALSEWTPDDLRRATSAGPASTGAGFAVATVSIEKPADTFLALPGSVHGLVWVNGFLLGRYWDIGPQVTLYCPAPLLRAGENTVVVLETDRLGPVLELRDHPELGPTEEYVEEFD
ncbi:glycoside hydrolase family 35 protein [Micromonospora zamorensis]|uniref:glycoside hydrolase family 35 protein n=1 Tax=Micromonospora zamorensis TaxID=709883 RepID=UPI00081F8EBA|nr:beta-galactosidase [Micromonospora zamorensis]SCG53666.1 beta-galactosidase [Micromonospora zamorensis]